MFTGIVEATAAVTARSTGTITIERPKDFSDISIGQSIAVSGVCLTVSSFDDATFSFDIAETTMQKTRLNELHPGDRVNLERAMAANGRFDGHIVQGHVDDIAEVIDIKEGHNEERVTVRLNKDLLPYVVAHGSITLDGVALTVASLKNTEVTVALVPHTRAVTTLGLLKEGDTLNVEVDILGRYMVSLLQHS